MSKYMIHTAVELKIPVINGIIVVSSLEQAEARAVGQFNRGYAFADAALNMMQLTRTINRKDWPEQICKIQIEKKNLKVALAETTG